MAVLSVACCYCLLSACLIASDTGVFFCGYPRLHSGVVSFYSWDDDVLVRFNFVPFVVFVMSFGAKSVCLFWLVID